MTSKNTESTRHRFMDEAGDITFYGKGRIPIIGIKQGISLCFILGMVKFRTPLEPIRQEIRLLQKQIEDNPYFKDIPSIQKKKGQTSGYYFHATDDIPEVRKIFYDYIRTVDLSFEAVVGRKIPSLYESQHNGNEADFYADLLSHLLKNKLELNNGLVLNVSQRGNVTKNNVFDQALKIATSRFLKRKTANCIKAKIVFNVQNPHTEPLLNVPDYLCWAIQRVFERGEMRYYNYLAEKISLIVDLYDCDNYQNNKNYYRKRNPLTPLNKISPPSY